MAQTDLWATIFDSEGLPYDESYGTPVFDVPEDEERTRIHCWQTYTRKNSLDEWVYEIDGPGADFANWTEVSHAHYDKFLMD